MSRRLSIIATIALIAVAAVACAKAPQEDVDAAKADMDKARQAQAETWAPNEFQAADEDEGQAGAPDWRGHRGIAREDRAGGQDPGPCSAGRGPTQDRLTPSWRGRHFSSSSPPPACRRSRSPSP